ncbi:MAG: phosphoenolpyruvate--protein phosphotransferase [Lentisphaeraceae bacterium]|nr:phosphoenolpyruvate--protein phosphotransferase [Lentisphaeraceae bacterium]
MSFSKLNISIRWKMLAGFLVSALIPCILSYKKVDNLIILLVSLSVALSLAIFSIYRVMNTITKIQEKFNISLDPESNEHDELRLIDESLTHFSEYIEQSHHIDLEKTHDNTHSELVLGQAYHAHLQTGEPVAAYIWELPVHQTMELVSSAKLAGDEAKIVFSRALLNIEKDLSVLKNYPDLDETHKGIIDFQVVILQDPSLLQEVEKHLARGENLLSTISNIFEKYTSQLEQQDNNYLKERVADFHDLKQRLFSAIHKASGKTTEDRFAGAKGKIAICKHVLPSEVIALCNAGVAGIISLENTASSHAQILLSSLNVSSLSSIDNVVLENLQGHKVLLNTMKGELVIDPTPKTVSGVLDDYAKRKAEVITEPITLKSGEDFKVGVTINNPQIEITHATSSAPDFVGLFRTEMHFLGQKELPDEEALISTYRPLVEAFKDDLVVVRMLDLGGDKVSGFEPVSRSEENPCMGLRSMRLLLEFKELFRLQLRAILKVSRKNVCLLYPMVSGWRELEQIDQFVKQTVKELNDEGVKVEEPLKGIMVEVPSIVTRFEDYVEFFDVFNIGTNDLVQYSLAADRNNKLVADYYKSIHPSVLTMIKKVADECHKNDKRAIICGQMGSDLKLISLVVGLGIRNISVNWPLVNQLKKKVQSLDLVECQEIATRALECKSIDEVEKVLDL